MVERARILIVDDDTRIAASIRRALIYAGYDVDLAGDGLAALRQFQTTTPDLVLLDVMLPELDGIEVCRRLRSEGEIPILMLTARDATPDRVQGLDSGADDYLVKPFDYDELLARVRALLRRGKPARSLQLRFAGLVLDPAAHEVQRSGRSLELTALEFSLLQYFLRNPRQVLSREQLVEAVWGYDSEVGSNVVDVYIGYLRQKLEERGEPRLIQTVRGFGYVLRESQR